MGETSTHFQPIIIFQEGFKEESPSIVLDFNHYQGNKENPQLARFHLVFGEVFTLHNKGKGGRDEKTCFY